MSWPTGPYPGAVVTADNATELLDEVPATERLYTFEEVLGMVDGLGSLPEGEAEWREWLEGHVEHMAAGDFVIGRPTAGRSE